MFEDQDQCQDCGWWTEKPDDPTLGYCKCPTSPFEARFTAHDHSCAEWEALPYEVPF